MTPMTPYDTLWHPMTHVCACVCEHDPFDFAAIATVACAIVHLVHAHSLRLEHDQLQVS